MTFDQVRQLGVSLFASAGVAGLAIGLAARPLLYEFDRPIARPNSVLLTPV
jgi:hypothetical protein